MEKPLHCAFFTLKHLLGRLFSTDPYKITLLRIFLNLRRINFVAMRVTNMFAGVYKNLRV